MADRTETSFWAVWHAGLEWPHLFTDRKLARDRAHQLAMGGHGREVHVMKLVSQGMVRFSELPEVASGEAA